MLNEILPITVQVALILFIFREALDFYKQRKARHRKTNTIKVLLSEEIKSNYNSLDALYTFLEKIEKANSLECKITKKVTTDRYGSEYIHLGLGESGKDGSLSMYLPPFSSKNFDSHLSDIIELDDNMYKLISSQYEKLREFEKTRNSFVCYLAGEMLDVRQFFLGTYLDDMIRHKTDNFKEMSACHKSLVGKNLTKEFGQVKEI